MRFEVLTAVKTAMFFWVVTTCGLIVDTNVSEKHTVSIFRAEVRGLAGCIAAFLLYFLISSSHLLLGLPAGHFPRVFSRKFLHPRYV
jgi:hypothetical protein